MKVNKKYIAYLAVIAVGAGWLGMDCLSGNTANASPASVLTSAATDHVQNKSSAPAPLSADMGDEPAIAQRLADLDATRRLTDKPITDAFALPVAFAPPAPKKAVVATAVVQAENFAKTHKLISVMVAGRFSTAMVDGKTLLKVGDTIDGFTLATMTMNSATFINNHGSKAVLGFKEAASSTATASIKGQ